MIIDSPKTSDRPKLTRLWQEAFGDTESYINIFFDTAFSPDRCLAVTVDGELAGALYWLDCELDGRNMAYIYAVATAKSYRGRGICAALMNDTHRHLEALGYSGALLVPSSDALFKMYEKLGYKTACRIGEFIVTANEAKANIRSVDKHEYAILRRKYLPEGGVIQENESLDLLEATASLYAGTDFLLSARIEKEKLIGIELLGSTSSASGIVAALGCKNGKFRTPHGNIPFAMYRPLDIAFPSPKYFGFAFD